MKFYSVTTALSPYSGYSDLERYPNLKAKIKNASFHGTNIHRICSTIGLGLFPIVPAIYDAYIKSFRYFLDNNVKEVIATEIPLKDDKLGFLGHPDFALIMKDDDGEQSINDLKTPIPTKKIKRIWAAQLAAYMHLANVNGYAIKHIGSLALDRDGKPPKVHWYKDSARDFNGFLHALNAYRWFEAA